MHSEEFMDCIEVSKMPSLTLPADTKRGSNDISLLDETNHSGSGASKFSRKVFKNELVPSLTVMVMVWVAVADAEPTLGLPSGSVVVKAVRKLVPVSKRNWLLAVIPFKTTLEPVGVVVNTALVLPPTSPAVFVKKLSSFKFKTASVSTLKFGVASADV